MNKREFVLQTAAARLEAVAQICGIHRITLHTNPPAALMLTGLYGETPVTVQVTGVGSRAVQSTVFVNDCQSPIELSLRPELAGEHLDKFLGMTIDTEVGDRTFDARFVIESAPVEAARKVLTPEVRKALLAFPQDDKFPTLRLHAGLASVAWLYEPDPLLLHHALTALTSLVDRANSLHEGVRTVSKAHAFRRDGDDAHKVDPGEREAARSKLRAARARAVVLIGSAVVTGIGFLATAILLRSP
jgi:hypothetical protein